MKSDLQKLYAPFGITIRQRKIAYCNNNIIPLLIELGIDWNMNVDCIIFCNRRFPMSTIDNGKAEEFIQKIIAKRGGVSRQSLLNEF